MTPDQKEAFERLKQAASKFDWHPLGVTVSAKDLRTVLDALSASQPAPAADTVQAVALDWEYRDDMLRVRREARRLWREDHGSCSWSEENRDCYMIRAAISLAHPTPLDAERVREDERDRLFEKAGRVLLITNVCDPRNIRASNVAAWLSKEGAMLPADRAALRQKDDPS